MKFPMRLLSLTLAFGLTATVCAAQQQPAPAELPSAPSSTLEKPKPQPPPPPVEQPAPRPAPAPAPQQQMVVQTPKPAEPAKEDDSPEITTIKKTVDEVNVVFTVTDKHGKFVKDLKKEDFKVIDDNKPAIEIKSFNTETNLPLRVGLLVD